VLEIDFQTLT